MFQTTEGFPKESVECLVIIVITAKFTTTSLYFNQQNSQGGTTE